MAMARVIAHLPCTMYDAPVSKGLSTSSPPPSPPWIMYIQSAGGQAMSPPQMTSENRGRLAAPTSVIPTKRGRKSGRGTCCVSTRRGTSKLAAVKRQDAGPQDSLTPEARVECDECGRGRSEYLHSPPPPEANGVDRRPPYFMPRRRWSSVQRRFRTSLWTVGVRWTETGCMQVRKATQHMGGRRLLAGRRLQPSASVG
ncbi:hypothetical protein JHW43_008878 [Diplocarpon mali]|nr:hypothetical protein JHW43_008878 [Diplocarpon mali]